jgi:phage repressor protein C with HTH and peptisase S24 domain
MPDNSRPKQRRRAAGSREDRVAFGERLKMIVRHWPSAERVAHASGISPSAFRKWLRGDAEPSRDRLVALARATNVSLIWLATGEGNTPDKRDLGEWTARPGGSGRGRANVDSEPTFVLLPRHEPEGAAAGSGDPSPRPATTQFIGFRSDWIHDVLHIDPQLVVLEVAIGDSMAPGIGDGDLLLVDTTTPKIVDFGIYVIEVRKERLVKRVQRKFDGSLILISDNPVYQPEEISAKLASEVTVIGRVVWRGGVI